MRIATCDDDAPISAGSCAGGFWRYILSHMEIAGIALGLMRSFDAPSARSKMLLIESLAGDIVHGRGRIDYMRSSLQSWVKK